MVPNCWCWELLDAADELIAAASEETCSLEELLLRRRLFVVVLNELVLLLLPPWVWLLKRNEEANEALASEEDGIACDDFSAHFGGCGGSCCCWFVDHLDALINSSSECWHSSMMASWLCGRCTSDLTLALDATSVRCWCISVDTRGVRVGLEGFVNCWCCWCCCWWCCGGCCWWKKLCLLEASVDGVISVPLRCDSNNDAEEADADTDAVVAAVAIADATTTAMLFVWLDSCFLLVVWLRSSWFASDNSKDCIDVVLSSLSSATLSFGSELKLYTTAKTLEKSTLRRLNMYIFANEKKKNKKKRRKKS